MGATDFFTLAKPFAGIFYLLVLVLSFVLELVQMLIFLSLVSGENRGE